MTEPEDSGGMPVSTSELLDTLQQGAEEHFDEMTYEELIEVQAATTRLAAMGMHTLNTVRAVEDYGADPATRTGYCEFCRGEFPYPMLGFLARDDGESVLACRACTMVAIGEMTAAPTVFSDEPPEPKSKDEAEAAFLAASEWLLAETQEWAGADEEGGS